MLFKFLDVGFSFVCLWSNVKFINLTLTNIIITDFNSIERIKDIVTPKDVIVVFSLGGSNKDVNNSILQAKRHGETVLTITTLGNHLLSKMSDHMIFIYDAPKKRENLRSRLMFNLVGNLLFEVILTEQQRLSSQ